MKHNLKGKRFGSLLVLDRNTNVSSKHIMWDCYCEDCGEFQTIRGASLLLVVILAPVNVRERVITFLRQ